MDYFFFDSNISYTTAQLLINSSTNTYISETNDWNEERPTSDEPLVINHSVIIGLLATIIAMAVIGNTFVICVIISDRKVHRAPFYFVVCMSLTDLCRAVFCVPFLLSAVSHDLEWTHGDTTCLTLAFANSFFFYSTSLCLLTVAIDRHTSLTYPRFYKKCSHGLVNIACILLGWGVAFCLSFPPVVESGSYQFIPREMQCALRHLPYRDNTTLGYVITFVCVQFTTLFLYSRLFSFLRSHRRMAPLYHAPATSNNWTFFGPGANGQALINLLNGFTGRGMNPFAAAVRNVPQTFGRVVNLRVIKNEHLSRLFFISSAIYSLLWIPYLFQVFMQVFKSAETLAFQYVMISTILCHSHVAICPYVYLFLGSPLRNSVTGRLKSWHQRHKYGAVRQSVNDTPEPTVKCIDMEV